ncbi:uncharacterized protein LOC135169310 [Diachasmimorpha longicaudata]|uniref:uncharacterized protein LOC135169310 n=1 Tax=Diachasmimorpha longicaudata TaxID=58733 RepID=UPI0030B8CA1C
MRLPEYSLNQFLYYYLKILGLCPFQLCNNNILVRCTVSTAYTCALSGLYIIIFIFMTKYRFGVIFSFETPMFVIANTLVVVLEFFAVMSVWMNGIFLQHVLREIIRNFRRISNSLRRFGCRDNHNLNIRRMSCVVLVVHGVYMTMIISDMFIHPSIGNVNWIVRIIFDVVRKLSHIFTALFICALWILKGYLCFINAFIRRFSDCPGGSIRKDISRRISCYGGEVVYLRALAQVRIDLQDLLKMIENFVRSPVLFFMITHLVNIASYLYVICLHFNKESNVKITMTFLLFFGWLIINSMEVLTTIQAVTAVVLEGNCSGNVFHRVIIEYYRTDVVDTVKVISLRFLQKPMEFSLYGFMDLNPSLFYKVSSAMATYFVILMQLDIQNGSHQM